MLTPPTWPVLIVSLLLVGAGVAGVLWPVPVLSVNAPWAMLAGYATLLLGVFSRRL